MVSVSTESREHIKYFGRDAVIVSENKASNTITIMLEDDRMITVDRSSSLFNAKIIDNSEIINKLQDKIDERAEDIKEQNKIWNIAKETKRKASAAINGLFSRLGITHAGQITKKEDKEQYAALVADRSAASMTQIKASAAIQFDVNSNLSDIYSKSNYQTQEILFT